MTKACSGHIPFTIVRPSVVYGPRDPHLFRIFKAAQKTGMFYYFGTGEKLLSLLHVQDLARGILLAATSGRSASQIYFLGSEQFYGLSDIRAALESALGRRVRAVKVPEAIKQLMMMYADLLNGVLRRKLLLDRDRLTTLGYPAWTCDVSKAKKDLGFEQTFALADGFERTFKWYRQHEWL